MNPAAYNSANSRAAPFIAANLRRLAQYVTYRRRKSCTRNASTAPIAGCSSGGRSLNRRSSAFIIALPCGVKYRASGSTSRIAGGPMISNSRRPRRGGPPLCIEGGRRPGAPARCMKRHRKSFSTPAGKFRRPRKRRPTSGTGCDNEKWLWNCRKS
jgi:hypothetical protein